MLSAIRSPGKTLGDTSAVGSQPPEDDPEARLYAARRERFFVRSRLKVLRRHRDRQAATGRGTAEADARVAELERELAGLDDLVEGLRASLGRPHRSRQGI
jgi:hypothetical protein